eukprot:m.167528 g.167528  ORF g.167528 m.167528 type:complete len:380 (+) comp14733_c0_seq2:261-1400(+)
MVSSVVGLASKAPCPQTQGDGSAGSAGLLPPPEHPRPSEPGRVRPVLLGLPPVHPVVSLGLGPKPGHPRSTDRVVVNRIGRWDVNHLRVGVRPHKVHHLDLVPTQVARPRVPIVDTRRIGSAAGLAHHVVVPPPRGEVGPGRRKQRKAAGSNVELARQNPAEVPQERRIRDQHLNDNELGPVGPLRRDGEGEAKHPGHPAGLDVLEHHLEAKEDCGEAGGAGVEWPGVSKDRQPVPNRHHERRRHGGQDNDELRKPLRPQVRLERSPLPDQRRHVVVEVHVAQVIERAEPQPVDLKTKEHGGSLDAGVLNIAKIETWNDLWVEEDQRVQPDQAEGHRRDVLEPLLRQPDRKHHRSKPHLPLPPMPPGHDESGARPRSGE